MAGNYRSPHRWCFIKMAQQNTIIFHKLNKNSIRINKFLLVKQLLNFMIVRFLLLAIPLTNLVSAEHHRQLKVSENAPIGYQIGFIGEFSHGVDSGPYLIVPVPGSAVDTDLAIDHTTGEIRTKIQLDREKRASYSLVAIPLSGENVKVTVQVLDENDNPPTFPTSVMNIEFPENTPRDVKRTLNPAKDLDLDQYNTQRYNIVSGNINNAFRLSSHRERDGVLYLDLQINGFLDRETTPAYSLVIEAMDGGNPPLRGQMTVNITIQDVNDNQPIFNQSRYFATIPENATVGTSVLQVYASDTDANENGKVEYSINRRQSDKVQMFRIDPQTGLISVNKPLDFETKELHELVVVAKDHGEQPLETTAFVSIKVTDVNDNQPTINVIFLSDDATPKISESAQPGEFVARISVNDPDSKTEYSNVNVSLSGGDGHFGLTTRDNIIYLVIVSLPLDRENQPNYTLNVIATDNGNPPLHAAKTIYLRVTDINDNPPEFEKSVYHANVMEVADPGTSVIQVVAIDKDEGNNSAVIYSLVNTPETHSQWFQIDIHTGLVTTRAHIDCETEPVPQITVTAKDNGYPPLSSTATILVTIHDVNDNEPIFDQSFYNVTIAENESMGRCILKVSASDPDCGVNAMVNYTLGDGIKILNEFEVRPATGEICISGDLDFETRNSYEFPVIATDRGGLSTTAMVKIQLTDVNDNRPVFYPKEYNVSLRESSGVLATSTPVVSVVATDSDSGRFGAVSYRIASGNEAGIFRIDRTTGEIFINRPNMLSSRIQPIHMLNISASDGGGLRTSQDAIIFISIIDATQRPPIFEKPRYHYYVKEDVQVSTVVGSVLASSSDSGSRGIVRYSIYSGDPDGYFNIDSMSGNIRIAKTLDHETKPQVLLNIQAMSGDPPAYGHTQVNIDIEDVNDNPPEFESNMVRISVPENVKLGTPLYAANAHDKDSGKSGIITYSIATIGSALQYNYNNNSNNLYGLSSKFESSSSTSSKIGSQKTFNQQRFYNANQSGLIINSIDLFAIDSRSGHLTLSRHLDFETSQRHSLVITATDSGVPPLSANLTIFVEVQDVNDNPPIFEQNEYSIKVLESMPINSQIVQVTAIDLDTGNNARLTYRIVGGNEIFSNTNNLNKNPSQNKIAISDLFGIFPNSGWIYLRSNLDRETCDLYELTVMASDNGTPSASAQTRVVVNVLDANDNDPKFDMDSYEFTIEENQKRGAFVGKIHATDLDLGINAAIHYNLIPSNTSFEVNPSTGEITAKEPLDRESRSSYDLVAESRDQATPYRSSRVSVKVIVTDVNDSSPELVDPQEDVVSVREEQPPGTEVVRVRATDRDNGKNSSITYSILKGRDSDGYGLFTIDPNTGLIRTNTVLDHEERSIYRLVVAATDGGEPPKQTVRLLRVEVLDLNDNRPTFTSSSLVFRVREDVPVGYIVGNIGPNDRNDIENTIINNVAANGVYVTYTLTPLTKDVLEGAFDIDRRSGSLVVARKLDREQQSEFKLEIRALDTTATNNPQSSAITVKVEIADVNDNPPKWSEDPIIINVNEDINVGEVLYNFTATDADSGSNGELQYQLLKHSPQADLKIFSLDPLTGALTLQESLDFETIKEYILIVCALDQSSNQTERLKTTVTARIIVNDANDNSPLFIAPPSISQKMGSNNVGESSAIITLSDAIMLGDMVTHVIAVDNDAGDYGKITYKIIDGNEEGRFRIDSKSGVIELAKSLTLFNQDIMLNGKNKQNYYHQEYINKNNNDGGDKSGTNLNKFNLVISASDHGVPISRKTHLNLKIFIHGTTSNPPRFVEAVYHANISENTQSGSFVIRVGAKSFNAGDNANLTYFIPPGAAENHFQVDELRGEITTRGQFDRETIDNYQIPIYVFERSVNDEKSGSNNNQFDTAIINVKIIDINDHAPEFRPGSCYPLSVPENSDLAVIHTVVATDLDEGQNGEIIYSIIGGNLGNKFSIDMHTGELTARSLDREQHSRYVLQIQAQDRGTPITYQGHCNISVIVEDQNDNDPRFEQSKYIINIPEDLKIGSSVLQLHANDADSGINSRLVYSLANETQWIFSIDNRSGLITTVGTLDREHQHIYNFMVVATDGGRYDSRSQFVPVQIIIDDVNDNKPIFEHYPFTAQVPALLQPGQIILHVNAIDVDQGINAEILYSLVNDSMVGRFRINPNTGAVSATQSLASDSGKLLHLEVMARDKGNPPKSSIGLIEIKIGDSQNGSPALRFQNNTYHMKLKENTLSGRSVLQVNAVRTDGRRQKIFYSIGAGNDDESFSIDASTGEIRVKQSKDLDFEMCYISPSISGAKHGQNNDLFRKKCYEIGSNVIKLIIVARTDGQPLLYGYVEVHIELEDENDHSPHFTQQQYTATVWEGNNKGTFVIQVQALDADFRSNSKILYHIVDGNHDNAFAIEPAFSGIVKTNIVLDREIRDLYRLKVIATDEGVPQMTGTATIHVKIIDVNDNHPTFPPKSVINVSEGTELGTIITTVSANDVDTNPTLTYRFSEGNIINNISNYNNNNNNKKNEEDISIFSIDRYSGKIILKKHLNYEHQQEFQLEIIASDTAHEAKTILTVRVTDENDNAPIFKQPSYYVTLLPDQLNSMSSSSSSSSSTSSSSIPISLLSHNSISNELITVNATDSDGSELNSKISYKISPNVNGFTINQELGIIYVNSTQLINNSSSNTNHKDIYLNVIAVDGGQPKLQSTAIVRVQLNSNSNSITQFLQSQYRLQVNENTKLGTEIFKLSKDIIDSEKIQNLEFQIISGNDDNSFEVYQSSSIILIKNLDREQNNLYKLRLVMTERTSQSSFSKSTIHHHHHGNNSTSIDLFVTIEDDNDNYPIFEKTQKYQAEISELTPLRYSIIKILATDADAENSPNSEVVYDITSGNDEGMFTIDLVTGILFVNNELDYDKGAFKYDLIIRACDSGFVPKCTLNTFIITLTDENDNAPRFPVSEYMEFLGENEPIGTTIFTARATDLDRGNFGQLNYTIEGSGNDDSWKLFRINSLSGIITSHVTFDYEQRHRYTFNIVSTDKGGKNTIAKVKIFIDSRDEFNPQFTERTYRFTLSSTSYLPLGYVIGQVQATDRDKGPDGRIVYQLSSQHAYFKINRTTGAILLKKKIDSALDQHNVVSLVISASSGRQGSLTNMTVVEISVDALADPGTNLASNGSASGGFADWALGLLISFLLIIFAFGAVYIFLHVRNRRRLKQVTKPSLSTETVGNSNSYVDPSSFDTIPIRGVQGAGNSGSQFPPPKYDEIPPYGPASSNSGAATTSELSGSEQSGSSGRGSAEDDGEDEEIRMINEGGPLHRAQDHHHNDDGRLSGLSVQNTQEYLARLGIVDAVNSATGAASTSSRHCSESIAGSNKETIMHHPTIDTLRMFNNDTGTESDITNLIYAKLNDVVAGSDRASSNGEVATTTAASIGATVEHVMGFGDGQAPTTHQGPSMTGSLSSIVHSEEELTGSYNWDYLLDWGPQYQPLAHVFSEIARLKDDTLSVHSANSGASSAKNKSIHQPKHVPPPLITNVAPRSIPVLSSNRGSHHSSHQFHHIARSPITHDDSPGGAFSTASAMSPSFSPSLSPLATRSPSISPHVVVSGTSHHMVSIPRHLQQSQPNQRKNLDPDMRIRM